MITTTVSALSGECLKVSSPLVTRTVIYWLTATKTIILSVYTTCIITIYTHSAEFSGMTYHHLKAETGCITDSATFEISKLKDLHALVQT